MAGTITSKPLAFSVLAAVAVLVGTVVTMAYPLVRPEMHVKVPGLKPLSPLELAGRDVYQREGCVNCHTQTVRPLRSEVVRYKGNRAAEKAGQYSLAGEFAYDHPFLWGSKRTGPDLAFEGWIKPSASWHAAHFENPQAVVPRSNMPAYAFLKAERLDAAEIAGHMRALRRAGVPYGTDVQIAEAAKQVQGKTAMDALVAYTLSLGKAVNRGGPGGIDVDLAQPNPLGQSVAAVTRGKALWESSGCGACHGDEAHGVAGIAPDLLDDEFLGVKGDLPDAAYFALIKSGSEAKAALGRPGLVDGGMQAFGADLSDDDVWAIVSWLRNQKAHEATESPRHEAGEHAPPAPIPGEKR
ncbi:MAG TPA: cbb3-type cytochrome c oxidase subunit II [Anaeromyxobacter sp.]